MKATFKKIILLVIVLMGLQSIHGHTLFHLSPQQSITVLDDPGNVAKYRGKNGTVLYFKVRGSDQGSVWGGGNGIYTDDSKLAKAAVHAGVLKNGETGTIKVTILAGQSSYQSSTRNGITSSSYGSWVGSFKLESFK